MVEAREAKFNPDEAHVKWAKLSMNVEEGKKTFTTEDLYLMGEDIIKLRNNGQLPVDSPLELTGRDGTYTISLSFEQRPMPVLNRDFIRIISTNNQVSDLYDVNKLYVFKEGSIKELIANYSIIWRPLSVMSPITGQKIEVPFDRIAEFERVFIHIEDQKSLNKLGRALWKAHILTLQ